MVLDAFTQPMQYSLQSGKVPIYNLDGEGNIKYIEVNGVLKPEESGYYTTGYTLPVKFKASISNKLNEVLVKSFGIDDSTNYAQIVADKDSLPIKAGSLIWRKSEVKYKDNEHLTVNPESADYICKGIADEGLFVDLFLLQKVVKDETN